MKLSMKDSTILITGASSGMGKEIAIQLADDAKQIILVARNEKQLNKLADTLKNINPALNVLIQPCDLSERGQLEKLVSNINQEFGGIDLLINCAGLAQIGFLHETDFDEIDKLVKINILALSALTRAFLPVMIKNGKGGILNFSSFFGLKILPAYSAYAGTKHFVTGFSDSLRAETAGTGVIVSTVFPGPVKSSFWSVDNAELFSPPSFLFISIQKCVSETLKGFKRGKARIIPGLRIKLLIAFLNLSPEPIVRAVNAGISRYMKSKQQKAFLSRSPDSNA